MSDPMPHPDGDGLGPGQEVLLEQIEEDVDEEGLETQIVLAEDILEVAKKVDEEGQETQTVLTSAISTRASSEELSALSQKITEQGAAYVEQLRLLTEEMAKTNSVIEDLATTEKVEEVHKDTTEILRVLDEDVPWSQTENLIDIEFRPVLGVHTGGGSDPKVIVAQIGQSIQAATIYWKKAQPTEIVATCQRFFNQGTVPRLEMCTPHIATARGWDMNGGFWLDAAEGIFDDMLIEFLVEVGKLDRPIFLSSCHEGDLRNEDGASPKAEDPPRETYCGAWRDFPYYWERFAYLAREYAPKARLFLNFQGGYDGSPERWSQMLPAGGTFDFFGWDPYSQYGKTTDKWDSFEDRLKLFGRWDWYKRNLPDVPVIIGETGVCEGPDTDGERNAGKWLLDMIDFMVENRWQGVGTGGGISQIHYFSHHYDAHTRCLDDNRTHGGHTGDTGQKWGVLPLIGMDGRLGWAQRGG